jgi:hypothetical protein
MSSYRLYMVSVLTLRFEPAQELDAEDDQQAIAAAEVARAARAAELWQGNRMVMQWTAVDAPETENIGKSLGSADASSPAPRV